LGCLGSTKGDPTYHNRSKKKNNPHRGGQGALRGVGIDSGIERCYRKGGKAGMTARPRSPPWLTSKLRSERSRSQKQRGRKRRFNDVRFKDEGTGRERGREDCSGGIRRSKNRAIQRKTIDNKHRSGEKEVFGVNAAVRCFSKVRG